MAALWRTLIAGSRPQADAAVDRLADGGDRTVSFLAEQLRQASPDEREVARLIGGLDAGSFRVRDRASDALRRIGPACAQRLRKALATSSSEEVKARIGQLLAEFSRPDRPDPRSPLFHGAVSVLARIGSDQARRALREMAAGGPDEVVRVRAAAALSDIAERRILRLLAAARMKGKAGDMAAALVLSNRALGMAVEDDYRGTDSVRDVRDYLLARGSVDDRLARSLGRAGSDRDARTELMWLYLVETDAPERAVECLDGGADTVVARRVRLAAAGPCDLSAEQAMEMARWYEKLARDASLAGRGKVLARARACYLRYLAKVSPAPVDVVRALAIVEGRLARVEVARNMWIGASNLLDNAGFEKMHLRTGWPGTRGLWGGDSSQIVEAGDGVKPHEGSRMLRFRATGFASPSRAIAAQVCQVVDVKDFRNDIRAGRARMIASARFNRLAGGRRTDTIFGISLWAYAGEPETHWRQKEGNRHLARAISVTVSDADPGTWEKVVIHMLLPKGTDFVAVEVRASEDVHNDTSGPEFDGHYADTAFATVICDEGSASR